MKFCKTLLSLGGCLMAGACCGAVLCRLESVLLIMRPAWFPLCFLIGSIGALFCRDFGRWFWFQAGLCSAFLLCEKAGTLAGLYYPGGLGIAEGLLIQAAIGAVCLLGSASSWSASSLRWFLFASVLVFSLMQKQPLHWLCLCCAFAGMLMIVFRSTLHARSRQSA